MSKHPLWKRFRTRSGQAIVLLLAILMTMVALSLWIFDTHSAILKRILSQDAGDPAVLAAARWQAAGINLCGELNLIHAYMLADDLDNLEEAEALFHLQQRVSLFTPILALQAAQVVARENGAEPLEDAHVFLKECAKYLEFEHLYEGATEDFQNTLQIILQDDIYAFPSIPGPPEGSNFLCNQDFYEAILGDDYCWFWFNAPSFLEHYRNFSSFGRIPEIKASLFFDLSLTSSSFTLNMLRHTLANHGGGTVVMQMNQQLQQLGHPTIPPPKEKTEPASKESATLQTWMVYDSQWHPWWQMRRAVIPIRSDIKPEFDTFGAAAAVTVIKKGYPWMCAAKPFGSINGEPIRSGDLVLGGFKDVRLVPIDAVDAGRPFNPDWLRHLYRHVTYYNHTGKIHNNCRYCSALYKLDMTDFRYDVTLWLSRYGHTCRRPQKPGNGDSGGVNYAH